MLLPKKFISKSNKSYFFTDMSERRMVTGMGHTNFNQGQHHQPTAVATMRNIPGIVESLTLIRMVLLFWCIGTLVSPTFCLLVLAGFNIKKRLKFIRFYLPTVEKFLLCFEHYFVCRSTKHRTQSQFTWPVELICSTSR